MLANILSKTLSTFANIDEQFELGVEQKCTNIADSENVTTWVFSCGKSISIKPKAGPPSFVTRALDLTASQTEFLVQSPDEVLHLSRVMQGRGALR